MIIKLNQLIYKYELLKKDCIEDEKFHEAKICKTIIDDLKIIKSILERK